jgi:DNA-binding Lrp family transcriptional regulator
VQKSSELLLVSAYALKGAMGSGGVVPESLRSPEVISMAPDVVVILNIFVQSKELDNVTKKLLALPEVKDLYEVTGEYDIVATIETKDIAAFRIFIKEKILAIDGIRSTVSAVILYTHKKEGKPVS